MLETKSIDRMKPKFQAIETNFSSNGNYSFN